MLVSCMAYFSAVKTGGNIFLRNVERFPNQKTVLIIAHKRVKNTPGENWAPNTCSLHWYLQFTKSNNYGTELTFATMSNQFHSNHASIKQRAIQNHIKHNSINYFSILHILHLFHFILNVHFLY